LSISRPTLPVLAALLLIATAHSTAYAQGASGVTLYHSMQDTTRDWFAYNPCLHENMHFSATQHSAMRVVRNGNSTLSMFRLNYSNGTGVGVTTGLTYILTADEQEVTLSGGPSGSSDFVLNNRLTGQGVTPDIWLHQVKRTTWDSSGYTITAKADTVMCR
jgi:hypothetical protein